MQDSRLVATPLLSSLVNRVADVRVDDPRSLSIVFDGGLTVRFIDGHDRYEAFQVGHGERLIIV